MEQIVTVYRNMVTIMHLEVEFLTFNSSVNRVKASKLPELLWVFSAEGYIMVWEDMSSDLSSEFLNFKCSVFHRKYVSQGLLFRFLNAYESDQFTDMWNDDSQKDVCTAARLQSVDLRFST